MGLVRMEREHGELVRMECEHGDGSCGHPPGHGACLVGYGANRGGAAGHTEEELQDGLLLFLSGPSCCSSVHFARNPLCSLDGM